MWALSRRPLRSRHASYRRLSRQPVHAWRCPHGENLDVSTFDAREQRAVAVSEDEAARLREKLGHT